MFAFSNLAFEILSNGQSLPVTHLRLTPKLQLDPELCLTAEIACGEIDAERLTNLSRHLYMGSFCISDST